MKDSKQKSAKRRDRPTSQISDQRFANFGTDPRFKLPSKKHAKTTLDKRFAGVFQDKDFTSVAKVDRYGRKIKSDSRKKALQRLYQQDNENDKSEDEDENGDEEQDKEGDDEEQLQLDDDDLIQQELLTAHEDSSTNKYDAARGGGFSSSSSDSESDSDSDSDSDVDENTVAVEEGHMQRFQDEQADVEVGEVTNRIAIVNLDWDHVKSTDLMALFSSFVGTGGGRIDKVSVYPSEFGKERMQQEEVEGPPKALFKSMAKEDDSSDDSHSEDSEDSEDEDAKIKKELIKEGDDQDFDSDALRSYQLDRLRYYYAVMVCSSPNTAQNIYEATDGTEFQSSSNFIDLRFIPDDVTFDDEPRDECDKIPDSYKPVEFVTNALQSSKVKLTWDMHPEESSRKESINRAFSGSRAEIEENDLRAYLASDSDDDQSADEIEVVDADAEQTGQVDAPKLSKKELARKKMREALGLADEPASKSAKGQAVGDMEITFTPAFADSKPKKDEGEETTIEKYKRKERERKESKRQVAKAKREGASAKVDEDDEGMEATGADELGFDDPFFTTEDTAKTSKASIRKEERRKKREAREAAEAESAEQKAHLTKVMAEDAADDRAEQVGGFNMAEIMRAEKEKTKKSKHKKKGAQKERGGLQENFKMEDDDRFKAVFDSHEFAIDPSNPTFKASAGMKKLLEDGRKKRRAGDGEEEVRTSKKTKTGRR